MTPFQSHLIIAGLTIIIGFGAGWKVNSWKYAAEREAAAEGTRKALEATAKEIAKIDVKAITIRQEVEKHVIEKPVYRECRHDPDTFRLLNNAITGQIVSDSKLPKDNTVDR